jgi:hypothetical protein
MCRTWENLKEKAQMTVNHPFGRFDGGKSILIEKQVLFF